MSGPRATLLPVWVGRERASWTHKERDSQSAGWKLGWCGEASGMVGAHLGVEDVAGDPAEHEQPILLQRPGDPQPRHPLQGTLVCLVMVTPFVLVFWELF